MVYYANGLRYKTAAELEAEKHWLRRKLIGAAEFLAVLALLWGFIVSFLSL